MKSNRVIIRLAVFVSVVIGLFLATSVFAAASGSFVFDLAGDAGDNADGPQYDITLVSPTDDGGGCDQVIMVIVDANGTVGDIDPNCISTATGTGSDDGDLGVVNLPAAGPATYALFDVNGADATVLAGLPEGSPAYMSYLLSHGTLLDEDFINIDTTAFPAVSNSSAPYRFGAAPGASGGCTLVLPEGSVVGELPYSTQIFYEPGNISPGLFLNPGTYHVVGQDSTESFYKLFVACQYIWVPKSSMQPSYQAPQNGTPLPTRIVS